MNKMKKYRNLALATMVALASGCSDMLDIKPTTFISDEALWEDSKLINQFVANTYGSMLCGFNRCTAGVGQDWAMSWAGNLDSGTDDVACVSDSPIYLQLMERIQHDIISGVYQPGDKLPSVRDLAVEAAVNPNTMQKALSELERCGLVYSQRTSGRFITDDTAMIKKMRTELAQEHIRDFFDQMRKLGFSDRDTLEMIRDTIRGD